MKHTPGPWYIDRSTVFTFTNANSKNIIAHIVGNNDNEETRLNRSLISAAPELLKVLKKYQDTFNTDLDVVAQHELLDSLQAVIRLAEGGKS